MEDKMMLRRLFIIVLLMFFAVNMAAETKVLPMDEHVKPFRIRVDDQRIYIGEGPEIFIYSRDEFKLLHKFGKAGEGPQEFKLIPEFSPDFDVNSDMIVAFSIGKLSFFTKTGKFKKELKLTTGGGFQFYRAAGNKRLIGERVIRTKEKNLYVTVDFYDDQLKNTGEIFRFKHPVQPGKKFSPIRRGIYIPNFFIYDGKIFIGGALHSGTIHVFDIKGKFLYKIKPPLEKVPYTEADKRSYIEEVTANDEYRKYYERIKHMHKYPDHFPMFQDFVVTGGRIYVQTFKRNKEDTQNEVFILDLEGKLIKRVWLPFDEYMDYTPCPYMIHKNKLYQCVDDEDEGDWKLHITTIK